MKRVSPSTALFLALAAAIAGCGDARGPVGPARDDGAVLALPRSPMRAPGSVLFSDDFEAGLLSRHWIHETVNSAQWVHASQIGAGYIHSQMQYPCNQTNRYTDIITTKDDFTDFTMTWDLRFQTGSWHSGKTAVHFRADDDFKDIHGYLVNIGIAVNDDPAYQIKIEKNGPNHPFMDVSPTVPYPWQLGIWYSFRLEARGTRFKLKAWPKAEPEPTEWLIETVDTDASWPCRQGRIGFGSFWATIVDADNIVVSSLPRALRVGVDIKPGSCPNPLNMRMQEPKDEGNPKSMKGGALPVAILGGEDLDVGDIDVSSVLLSGIAPARSHVEDVAAPPVSAAPCACGDAGTDGFDDLILHFRRSDVIAALGPVPDRSTVELTVTGRLLDGTAFEGTDCVLIIGGDEDEAIDQSSGKAGERIGTF